MLAAAPGLGWSGARRDALDRATLPFSVDRIPHHFPSPGAVGLDPVVDGEREGGAPTSAWTRADPLPKGFAFSK